MFKSEEEDVEESNSVPSKSDGDDFGLKRDTCPSAVLDAEGRFVGAYPWLDGAGVSDRGVECLSYTGIYPGAGYD